MSEQRGLQDLAYHLGFAKQPDPLQESLAAIRDAITSRDRHFDAIAEQLRLLGGKLDKMASWLEAIQHRQGTIDGRFAAFEAALKVLGAQLEGIERHFTLGPSWTQGFTAAAKQYNLELTQHLKAILAQLTESKRHKKQEGRKKAKR